MYKLITVDVTTDEVKGLGALSYRTHPRVGEWVEINVANVGTLFQVVMVGHSSEGNGSDLYVKRLGRTGDVIHSIVGK